MPKFEALPGSTEAAPVYRKKINREIISFQESPKAEIDIEQLDLSRFDHEKSEMIRIGLSIVRDWVERPSIHDSFTDHVSRRAWEKTLGQPLQEWLGRNKFGVNEWGAASMWLAYLPEVIHTEDPSLADRLREITAPAREIQHGITRKLSEKTIPKDVYLAHLKELEAISRRFLSEFTHTYSHGTTSHHR